MTTTVRDSKSVYDASQIQMLRGMEAVRENMGMYLGGNDSGALHHLVYEVVDNSVDEALAGYCDTIIIELRTDGSVAVIDNGRGIPTGMHPVEKRSALELALTELHAGGKFKGSQGYKVSGGLHGVGVSAVNAVSSLMRAEIKQDGKIHVQEYHLGVPQGPVKVVGKTSETGTTIVFKPADDLFTTTDFHFKTLANRFREMAYLTKGLRFKIIDRRSDRELSYYFDGGIVSFVRHLTREKGPLLAQPFYVEKQADNVNVEVTIQYSNDFNENLLAFTNNIANPDGGTHVTGFRSALTRTINAYGRNKGLLKEGESLSGDDVREGMTAIISVKLFRPQFESQTKVKLATPEAKTAVETVLNEAFGTFLEENPAEGKRIIEKALLASRARDAARKARDLVQRKGALEGFALPGKLADCSDKEPAHCELFVVEGDSAGGCWIGSTMIQLASGEAKTIQGLAEDWERGITHFGYATNEGGDVRIVPLVHPRLTKRDAHLVEVELDNGERVRCTPDHPFRLRDGSYRAAEDLQPDDSLMPFKRRSTNSNEYPTQGYEKVWMNGQNRWILTHILADIYNLHKGVYVAESGDVRHHRDFNKCNNDPRNIVRMTNNDHLALHREYALRATRKMWADPAHRQKMSEMAKQQWEDPEYRQAVSERVKLQRQDEELNQRLLDGFENWYDALSLDDKVAYAERLQAMQAEYWADGSHRQEQSERVRQYFEDHPEVREEYSQRSKEQWQDEELLEWRSAKTIEQWQDPEYRQQHSDTVKQWWADHPEHAEKIVEAQKRTWNDPEKRERISKALAEWRENTPIEERSRKIGEGHKLKALGLLNSVLNERNIRAAYDQLRAEAAPTALRYDSLIKRYFDGDEAAMLEAATNYNCKVVAVRQLDEQADVYDITVDKYHNFALAAGVFVHNSAKQGRDRRFQAILPLRGKILNVEKARLDKMLANNEVKALVTAMGTGIGETFDLDRLRYHRLVIMTDADVDGSHIRTLLLTFFFRHMREIINNGHLYIAQPPLFRVQHGKQSRYVYSETDRDEYIKSLSQGTKVMVQRFKGLGEMNPEQLWETTLDPQNRLLLQVTVEDAMKADETFTMLMGDHVPPRRRFIQTHAADVRNLDV